MDSRTIYIIILGIVAGIIAGSTGLAAAGAILLGLTFSGIVNDRDTITGTTLYTLLFPTVILGVLDFHRRGKIDYYVGNILVVVTIFSTFIGAYLTRFVPQQDLIFLTGCLLLASGGMFIKRGIVGDKK